MEKSLIYAVGITILAMVGAYFIVEYHGPMGLIPFVGASALVLAIIGGAMDIGKSTAWYATSPIMIFFGVLILWPIFFPKNIFAFFQLSEMRRERRGKKR